MPLRHDARTHTHTHTLSLSLTRLIGQRRRDERKVRGNKVVGPGEVELAGQGGGGGGQGGKQGRGDGAVVVGGAVPNVGVG